MSTRVLVSSLTPASGGVATMTRFVLDALREGGLQPILAHYEPYGMTPRLSTPLFSLGRRRPGTEQRVAYDGVETHAIGAWLPELEFTHFRPGPDWCRLMERCDRYLAISGNVLAASPFALTDQPFLAWVATGWREDRTDRVKRFPLYRKVLDKVINSKVLERRERKVLRSGSILALSQRTREVLDQLAGRPVVTDVLPMPVDTDHFRPAHTCVSATRVGFVGRFNDPRKNTDLLLEAFAQLAARSHDAQLVLVGGSPDRDLLVRLQQLGLSDRVQFTGFLNRSELVDVLQCIDVFVVPSWQEGLCIAALEAMACGCPVVSTRCGGPEEFVRNDETGCLVGFDAKEMAAAIERIIGDRDLHERLSQNARQLVVEHYNRPRCEAIFWNSFEAQNKFSQENGA